MLDNDDDGLGTFGSVCGAGLGGNNVEWNRRFSSFLCFRVPIPTGYTDSMSEGV